MGNKSVIWDFIEDLRQGDPAGTAPHAGKEGDGNGVAPKSPTDVRRGKGVIDDADVPEFTLKLVTEVRAKVEALKIAPGHEFVATEIAELETMVRQQEVDIAAKKQQVVLMNRVLINDRLVLATKMAARRAGFDDERPKADTAINTLEAFGAPVAAPVAKMKERLTAADALATKTGMQFEDAATEVGAIIKDCATFSRLAQDAQVYTRTRADLAAELTALQKHAAAGQIKAELDVVGGLMDGATKAAGDTGAPGTPLVLGLDPSKHNLATANAQLAQARNNLATAQKLADGLGPVAAAQDAVKGQTDFGELTKAAEALAKELTAAQSAPHADLAKADLDAAKAALDDARKQIDAKQPDPVQKALGTAGEKLTAARRLQIEHARFLERQGLLNGRLEQLKADPAKDKIKGKIEALAQALAGAAAADKAKDFAKAMAGLDAAETAAGAADAALVARAAFDKEAEQIKTDLKQAAYASIQLAEIQALTKARGQADAVDFAGADKALKAIRSRMAATDVEATAKSGSTAGLADKAKALMAAGGGKELDALIGKLPNNLDKQVFIELAQARFKGITFDIDDDGKPQKTIQRMCKLMAVVPDDVVQNNPSLKKIKRDTTESAPYYQGNTDEVVMAPVQESQESEYFGTNKATRAFLPPREENCKPANDKKENLFDWNMWHELAHSIDDARNFMGQHGGKEEFGGWKEYGGDVTAIVQAAVAAIGFGTTPDELKHVQEAILGNSPDPTPFSGAKFDKFDAFIQVQSNDVWESEADSAKATLGDRIYQKPYGANWMSYLASARKKGITAYQFRAPGEWFSELYAAWKVKKLKPNHPAVPWLSKLKV